MIFILLIALSVRTHLINSPIKGLLIPWLQKGMVLGRMELTSFGNRDKLASNCNWVK